MKPMPAITTVNPASHRNARTAARGRVVLLLALALLVDAAVAPPARAQVSLGLALPGVSIGINVPVYPRLVRVPGYPVYYDPQAASNYFFYDGAYWVYSDDSWYESTWYNGPWQRTAPEAVPLFVLRVPVRYYRQPPPYFNGWRADAPPRWGEHWGPAWQQHRPGWDQWNHRAAPAPAPLPAYQQKYPNSRYPQAREQQDVLRAEHYRFQPRDQDRGPDWGHDQGHDRGHDRGPERSPDRGHDGPGKDRSGPGGEHRGER